MIHLKVNNKVLTASADQTILEVARKAGINIPSLCYHPDLSVKANCRICVVEIKGRDKLVTACSTHVFEGMEINTLSPKVIKARRLNLELILAEHTKKCADCLALYDCDLLHLAQEYKVETDRLPERKAARKIYHFGSAVEIDESQCIDCQNCVEVCERQGVGFLKMVGHGSNQEVVPSKDPGSACIYCGQCALHCPVTAAQEKNDCAAVEKILQDPDKIVVAQFAPSIRVSLGEEFGMPYGVNCEGQIYTALKKLGFQEVLDVNFGADITTIVEAEELMERLKDKKAVWPMMTSCCPAWVAYVEFYHPELIPNLTTARSPHIHLAGAIKTYWADKKKINPKKISVVSIMPCTAKKQETVRPELKLNGQPLVDYVLTTRELAYLIKKNRIDFKNLPVGAGQPLFNNGSGAAAIYGASGGVMESALRTAVFLLSDKNKKNKILNSRLEFTAVRGLDGLKEASIKMAGKNLKVAVVNGLGNFSKILPKLKKYHYVEVMACSGGCIGGGGQPIPTTREICQKRITGLYKIDKSRNIRRAHENVMAQTYYQWVKDNQLLTKLIYTKFKKSKKILL